MLLFVLKLAIYQRCIVFGAVMVTAARHPGLFDGQTITCKRGSASTVLRTPTLSYGNVRFSGTCPAETPQPIKMKFCTIDYVGEVTRYAKNGWNRLARGGPTDRSNITSKTFLTIPYLTLLYFTFVFLVNLCSKNGLTDLRA
jgi:hypothetical protein